MSTRRHLLLAIAFGVPIVAAACGGHALQLDDVTPQAVPYFESEHAQHPDDVTAATRLGVAYFRANQLLAARAILDTITTADPRNGIAAIYAGMTAESQGDFAAARTYYQRFIDVARSRELLGAARQRLALVDRRELEYSARQALAQEAQLDQAPPLPNTIAVMPFAYAGTDPQIQPLTRGFAQLVVTDLAHSRQLRVLERERMQAMLDEMHLSEQGRADSTTAVRSGRLLRAARVVQGSLSDENNALRADAALVDVNSAGVASTASAADELNRLFDIEKVLVLQIFSDLGIQLTPAERSAVDQRPTQNLQAFLAWSRGLEAEDRGDFAAAQDLFNQAARLDPNFSAAAQSAQTATDLQQASTQSVADVDLTVAASAAEETGTVPTTQDTRDALTQAVNSVNPPSTTTVDPGQTTTALNPNPERKPSDATGTTSVPPQTATIRIIITRP